VGGKCTEGCSLPDPYTKLEVSGTKQIELEEENWAGHDPNMGQCATRKREVLPKIW